MPGKSDPRLRGFEPAAGPFASAGVAGLLGWSTALAIFAAALAVRWAMRPVLPSGELPFATFLPAVIATMLWCGRAPAVAVAVLSGLTAWGLFMPPSRPFALTPPNLATMGFFVFVCGVLIWLVDRLISERRTHAAREAQLQAILDFIPVGIVLAELPSGKLLEKSRSVERLLQRRLPDFGGFGDFSEWVSYHADGSRVSPKEYPLMRMLRENAEAPEIEVQYERGDGELAWTRMMGRLIRDKRGDVTGGVVAVVDVDAERRAQEAAQQLADEFRTLADNIPILVWMARPDGRVYWYNQRCYDYTGPVLDPEGQGWEGVIHPEALPQVLRDWGRAFKAGAPFETTFPMRGADGVFRPFLTRVVPIRDEAGRVIRWFGVNVEVSEQQRQEERQRLLMNELNHRVKNTLATVQSIAGQTLRSGDDPRRVFEQFESRLLALSEAHNLLTQTSWQGASVSEIVARATRPYQSPDRPVIDADGPAVWLRPESALELSMALHELGANAVRHGALAAAEGRVVVRWSSDPATGSFELCWTEAGGPPVAPPTRRGFGLRLITRALAGEREAKAELDFRPEGFVCRIAAALPRADAA